VTVSRGCPVANALASLDRSNDESGRQMKPKPALSGSLRRATQMLARSEQVFVGRRLPTRGPTPSQGWGILMIGSEEKTVIRLTSPHDR
jgi:hypothetical protein